ncbi:hypothetical protein AeNC1_004699 [Aphanomyces euteiches]|nr:hypothetical protein AeNC1_004699 [Aphanomyces euteiches]
MAGPPRQAPETTPEKNDVMRLRPRSILEIFPRSFASLVELLAVFLVSHCLLWAILPLLALAYVGYMGYWYISAAVIVAYLPIYLNGAETKVLPSQGGMQSDSFRQDRLWQLVASYLQLECIREAPLNPTERYVFGLHPNAISKFSGLAFCGGNFERLFPDISPRILLSSPLFYLPGIRELCLWLAGVDASADVADSVLDNGMSVVLYPGSLSEVLSTSTSSSEMELMLHQHLDFVKLAIRHGVSLVPTMIFGEKNLYRSWRVPQSMPDAMAWILRLPLLIARGRFGTWLPFGKRKLGVVFGPPIAVQQMDDPSEDEIRQVHAIYVESLVTLFESYKGDFGYDHEARLVLV